jgi:hypothetical protein
MISETWASIWCHVCAWNFHPKYVILSPISCRIMKPNFDGYGDGSN